MVLSTIMPFSSTNPWSGRFLPTVVTLFCIATVLLAPLIAASISSSTAQFDFDTTALESCPGDLASVPLRLSDFFAKRPDLAHFANFRVATHAITFFYRLCSDGSLLSATFGTVLINNVFKPWYRRDPSLSSPTLSTPLYFLDRRRKYPMKYMSVKHALKSSVVVVNNVVQSVHVHSLTQQNAEGYFILTRTDVYDVFVDTRALSNTCVSSQPSSCQEPTTRRVQQPQHRPEPNPFIPFMKMTTERTSQKAQQLKHHLSARSHLGCKRQRNKCASRSAQRVLKVTLVADHFYCANVSTSGKFKKNDGAAVFGNMKSTFDKVAEIFVSQTCILLDAVNFVAYCNPNRTPFAPSFYNLDLRFNFADFWRQKYRSSNHAKILLTGSGLVDSYAGSAGRGTICQPENSFAWAIGCNALVVAHELGHIIGASHDLSDMTSLMYAFTTEKTEPRFSTSSLNEMFDEIDCQSSRCMAVITPTPSPSSIVCTDTMSDTQQFGCSWVPNVGVIDTSGGTITITASQSYGDFVIRGVTQDSKNYKRRVAFMAAFMTSSSADIDGDTIVSTGVFQAYGSQGYYTGKLSYPAKTVIISPLLTTCCNQILFVHMKVGLYSTITNNGVESRKLFNATGKFPLRVVCNDPCAGDPDGRSIPAAHGVTKCPACI